MKRISRDFITLINTLWYRDFPLSENHKNTGTRAEWTTHIGICVRSASDLLGLFTHFEQGNRTDAVIRTNAGKDIFHIEWEWKQPINKTVNEIKKLKESRNQADVSVFFSYSNIEMHAQNLAAIARQWGKENYPLIIFLVTYEGKSTRWFQEIQTYHLQNGNMRKLRSQPALPWWVKGSRWESAENS
jgi:negative regulator of replication initiation